MRRTTINLNLRFGQKPIFDMKNENESCSRLKKKLKLVISILILILIYTAYMQG
jgi:hypothetical protein